MIGYEEAQRVILEHLPRRCIERVYFQAALNRVLAESLPATMDIPPFDRAAVDGYALRSADVAETPADLDLVGEVRAGSEWSGSLCAGQAVAIATGAPVPDGADAVQMVEHARIPSGRNGLTVLHPVQPGQNIVARGFEALSGAPVLSRGRAIGPAEVAILATMGYAEVPVWRRPSVALLATGDELVEIKQTPHGGQIRNSNAYSLTAQLNNLGIEPDYLGIAGDNRDDLCRKVVEGLGHEVLIISGGASVGPYDLVKSIFEKLGIQILFDRVAVRPGKPTIFALKDEQLVFGLPGNPVSSYISFENFVRPALGRMCGWERPELPRIAGELTQPMGQTSGRTAFLPALAYLGNAGWVIDPLPWKGSGDILGFSQANALVIFPGDRETMARSERVDALLLPDFFERRH